MIKYLIKLNDKIKKPLENENDVVDSSEFYSYQLLL